MEVIQAFKPMLRIEKNTGISTNTLCTLSKCTFYHKMKSPSSLFLIIKKNIKSSWGSKGHFLELMLWVWIIKTSKLIKKKYNLKRFNHVEINVNKKIDWKYKKEFKHKFGAIKYLKIDRTQHV
jgi:hypothetical protein